MRLNTYIQTRHQISRRKFVSLVKEWVIFVNGKKIDSYTQEIVAGDKIEIRAKNFQIDEIMQEKIESSVLILFNKPVGCVASKSDPHNKTIYDILPPEYHNYYYIWRLDKNSHGLLLLTNDPGLVHEYEHPKHGIEKEYIVELDIQLDAKDIQRVLSGVKDEEEILKALKVAQHNKKNHYTIVLNEWKKRHIRRMFKAIGYQVLDLERIREGKYILWNIKIGEWKVL